MYIEWGETSNDDKITKKLLNNTSVIQFNRVINGESFPYSQMDIISLNNKVISAGITSFALIFEESQDLSYEWASKQALPFLGKHNCPLYWRQYIANFLNSGKLLDRTILSQA